MLQHLISQNKNKIQKSHTYEEGGGKPQNFFLAFIDKLEKEIIVKKTIEVDQ